VDEALQALAEPRRRAILRLVASRELPAGQIAEHFDVTRQAVSQHLQVLEEAGLVVVRQAGTRRYYRADFTRLDELRRFLDEMWADSLDLARRLAEEERGLAEDDGARAAG
jgi:DNA-binding transcriptional ArsR family regulator